APRGARRWQWAALAVFAALALLAGWRWLPGGGTRSIPPEVAAPALRPLSSPRQQERAQSAPEAHAPASARADSAPHRSLEQASMDELLAVLAGTGNPAERMVTLTILRDRDEREAFERSLVALADPDGGVRAVAAEQLGRSGDRRAFSPLHEAFEREPVREVRETIATALIELDPSYDDQGAGGQRGEAVRNRRAGVELLREHAPGLDTTGAQPGERGAPPADAEPLSE
ncbi:MAG: HEAT repeat domain-containing protein, partial [Myxococcota bacterium]